MSNLNDLIDKTHFDYENNEDKAKQLEERILQLVSVYKYFKFLRRVLKFYRVKRM